MYDVEIIFFKTLFDFLTPMINILYTILLPIFIQIGAGVVVQKIFRLDIKTLSKLQFYILIPALLFTNLLRSNISGDLIFKIIMITVLIFLILLIISNLLSHFFKYSNTVKSSFTNSVIFINSGNYGYPLLTLLFLETAGAAISIQIMVLLTQNMLLNTYGIFNANAGNKSLFHSLIDTFKIPMIYAAILAIIFRTGNIPVPIPVMAALDEIEKAVVPVALITLGMQLAETKINFKSTKIYLSNFLRLIIAPILAIILVKAFSIYEISPLAAQVLVIGAGVPTAVNTVLLAIEYDNEPELSSQIVLSSTLLSAITVTIFISIARMLFPI